MIRVVADSSGDAAIIAEAVGGAAEVLNGVGPLRRGDSRVECVVLACRSPVPPTRLELAREIERDIALGSHHPRHRFRAWGRSVARVG